MNGPDGNCGDECQKRKFGALPPLPTGYSVWWHAEHEHYQGHGPNGAESAIDCNPYRCRNWCVAKAALDEKETTDVD